MAFAQRAPRCSWSHFVCGPGGWERDSELLHLPSELLLVVDKTLLEHEAEAALCSVEGPLPGVELQVVDQVLLSALAPLTLMPLEGALVYRVPCPWSQKHARGDTGGAGSS